MKYDLKGFSTPLVCDTNKHMNNFTNGKWLKIEYL